MRPIRGQRRMVSTSGAELQRPDRAEAFSLAGGVVDGTAEKAAVSNLPYARKIGSSRAADHAATGAEFEPVQELDGSLEGHAATRGNLN